MQAKTLAGTRMVSLPRPGMGTSKLRNAMVHVDAWSEQWVIPLLLHIPAPDGGYVLLTLWIDQSHSKDAARTQQRKHHDIASSALLKTSCIIGAAAVLRLQKVAC